MEGSSLHGNAPFWGAMLTPLDLPAVVAEDGGGVPVRGGMV